ncbi:MAG: hypothetical protein WDN48_07420 [Pseudolabrys sp.]
MTKVALGLAAAWMGVGNVIMFRLVQFQDLTDGHVLLHDRQYRPRPRSLIMALLVFLAAGTMAFAAMAFVRVRGAVKRRAVGILDIDERGGKPGRACASPA